MTTDTNDDKGEIKSDDHTDENKAPELSAEKLAEQDQRLTRHAQRILDAIIKAMPKVAKYLTIKGDKERVAHDVDIPGLDKYSSMIISSYVIVKGEKDRTIYFAILQPSLYGRLQALLSNNAELLKNLTNETINIQFACPEIDKSFQFKRRKKGLFGKEVYVAEFSLS